MGVRNQVRRIIPGWVILFVIVALLGKVSVAETDAGRTAAEFLLVGPGARAAGMGGAFTAVAHGATAAYWNPAGLAGIETNEILLSHSAWYQDMKLEHGAAAFRLSDHTALGAAITYFNYGTIQGYDVDGNPTEEISAYDMAGTISCGVLAGEKVSLGFSGKFIIQKLDDINGSTAALDLGARYTHEYFAVAAVMTNVGPHISFEDIEENLPAAVHLGAAVRVIEDYLTASADLEKRFHSSTIIHHGIEFIFRDQYYLRSGYKYFPGSDERSFGSDITIGVGLRMGGTEFDYAYTFREKYAGQDLHRFSMIFRYGP